MSQSLPNTLRDTIADILEIEPAEVTPELSATSVESWDSFRHLQLILALESEYGVQFDPGVIPELTSVSKLAEALQAKGANLGGN